MFGSYSSVAVWHDLVHTFAAFPKPPCEQIDYHNTGRINATLADLHFVLEITQGNNKHLGSCQGMKTQWKRKDI